MRITGGQLRSRTLNTSGFQGIRPTTDRARETIFNILLNYLDFEAISVLDLCAGSGALAFEALSRGAASAVLVEKHRKNSLLLAESARTLNLEAQTEILCGDAVKALTTLVPKRFHCIFADPPYALKLINPIFREIQAQNLATPDAIFVAEHDLRETVQVPQDWEKLTERAFGKTIVEFFQKTSPE